MGLCMCVYCAINFIFIRGTFSFNNVMVSTDTGTVYHGLHIILTEFAVSVLASYI